MRFVPALMLSIAIAAPVDAAEVEVRVPAGRAGEAAAALARQMAVSIVIADPALAARRGPEIRGAMSPERAVAKLARAMEARAIPAGRAGWRLVAAPPPGPRARAKAAVKPHPPTSSPQSVAPEVAPDIVVRSSKRDTKLADYAGQVALLDGAALTLGGVGGSDRIVERVASVTSTHLGSGRNKLFIRGIADSSFTGPTQSTVGMYLGDLRLNYNAPDPDLRLSDMASVEVLEGPQGTLYGAGSIGGIIRLVPNMPDLSQASGSGMLGGSLTQHGDPGADISLMANVPVRRDVAGLRLVVDAARQGGYIDKPLLGRDNVNRTDIAGGRAIFRVDAGNGWTIDLIGAGQRTRGADSQYADRSGPPLTRSSRVTEGFDADYAQGQVVVSGELGAVRFRSSTGVVGQELHERYDATPPEGEPRLFEQGNHSFMAANETRLWQPLGKRFGWLFGASYTHNRTRLTRSLGSVALRSAATGVENIVDEVTLYGEASLKVRPGLIATAGGRWTRSELGGSGEDVMPLLMPDLSGEMAMARAAIVRDRAETIFLPSASVLVQPLPGTELYLRYQEGFRPGGLAVEGDFVRRYRNDRVSTLEFGGRHGRPGEGPFDVSASVSFTDWRDIQADYIDLIGLPTTANIGNGHIWTATLSGGVTVAKGLHLEGAVVYNYSRVDQPSLSFGLALVRLDEVPNIASAGGRLGFDYVRGIGGGLTLTARGWARYVGPSRLGVGPELGARQGDYFDSGLTVRVGRPRLGVTVSLTNIADTVGNRFALGTPFATGRAQVTPLQPRTLRIGIDGSF